MAAESEAREPTAVAQPASAVTMSNRRAPMDVIKRTSPPQTADGSRWHLQLSGTPTREWLEFFKVSGKSVGVASPLLVVFDRASANFKSDEEHVEHWIAMLDSWIDATDDRYRRKLDDARRERSLKLDNEAKLRERVQGLNERFKHL
jgi:hypothetical protein